MPPAQNATQTDCLTPGQAAERLQVSQATVLYWLRTRRLHGAKLGYRTWRVPSAEIAAFLEREMVGATTPQQE